MSEASVTFDVPVPSLRRISRKDRSWLEAIWENVSRRFLRPKGKPSALNADVQEIPIVGRKIGAGEGIRTLDPDRGKDRCQRSHASLRSSGCGATAEHSGDAAFVSAVVAFKDMAAMSKTVFCPFHNSGWAGGVVVDVVPLG